MVSTPLVNASSQAKARWSLPHFWRTRLIRKPFRPCIHNVNQMTRCISLLPALEIQESSVRHVLESYRVPWQFGGLQNTWIIVKWNFKVCIIVKIQEEYISADYTYGATSLNPLPQKMRWDVEWLKSLEVLQNNAPRIYNQLPPYRNLYVDWDQFLAKLTVTKRGNRTLKTSWAGKLPPLLSDSLRSWTMKQKKKCLLKT